MDFQLVNYCDHKVINEELTPILKDGNYIALVKRPILGDNNNFYVLDSNNLFKNKEDRVTVKTILTDKKDKKAIIFTEPVIIEKTYPQVRYYITYTTSQANCPRCQGNKTWDISLDPLGKVRQITGLNKLLQQVKKAISTNLDRNFFNTDYGSDIPKMVGKPNTVISILLLQNAIQNVETFIKEQQSKDSTLLPSEKLLSFDSYEILPSGNPKKICFQFSVKNYEGQSETIQLEV